MPTKRTDELVAHAKVLRAFGFTQKETAQLCDNVNEDTIRNWTIPGEAEKQREANRRNYAANPQAQKERGDKWKAARPEVSRAYYRRCRAKENRHAPPTCTPEQEKQLRQNISVCQICGLKQAESKRLLHLDHDHDTGRVRGLLCSTCNTQLGVIDKYLRDTDYRGRVTAYYAASL